MLYCLISTGKLDYRQMNTVFFSIIIIPIIEIYLFIKIGAQIGALTTIILIFLTALIGVIYVRYEGLNTLKSGIGQILKNEIPIYEIISGAALAFAALLMILPGFLTDFVGILIIFPPTRKLIFKRFTIKNKTIKDKKIIDGEYEEKDDK